MTPRETIALLDTIHVKGIFGYLVKINLNSSCAKTEII